LPSKPARRLPYGSFAVPVCSKSMLIALVTPLMVSSPLSRNSSGPRTSTKVLVNVIVGKLGASKKSLVRR